MASVTPETTVYPFDTLDKYLYPRVHIPNYWVVRELAKAFSDEHVNENVPRKSRQLLVAAGFNGHRALTGVGGAYYHFELLETLLNTRDFSSPKNIAPRHFVVWEELEALFNDLYSAWNGIINFAYLIFCSDSIDPETMDYEGLTWGRGMKNRPTPEQFFQKEPTLKPIFDALSNCSNCFGIRHKAVHRYRSYLYLIQKADGTLSVLVPRDMRITQATIIPPTDIPKVDIVNQARESISMCEKNFDDVYKYIIENGYVEKFLKRYSLLFKGDL